MKIRTKQPIIKISFFFSILLLIFMSVHTGVLSGDLEHLKRPAGEKVTFYVS